MRGKGWLALSIGVAALAAWRMRSHVHRSEAPRAPEVSIPDADRTDLARTDSSIDAAPEVRRVEVHPAENLTAASGSTGRIHGHARDQDGLPLVGYPVRLVAKRKQERAARYRIIRGNESPFLDASVTSTDGEYEIRPIGIGDWWVGIVRSPEQGLGGAESDVYPTAELVQMGPGGLDREVDIVAYRGLTIEGMVVTPEGEPVKGSKVWAHVKDGGPPVVQVDTNEHGRFSLGALPPARFVLQASLPDEFLPSEFSDVMVETKDVRLELVHGGHLVVSTVDDRSGDPVAVSLTAVLRKGRLDGGPYSAWDGNGSTFDVKGLSAGTCDLIARTSDGGIGLSRGLNVDANGQAREVEIKVGSSATVALACKQCRADLVVELYSEEALVDFTHLHPGRSELFHVPPGPIRVRLEPVDPQSPQRLDPNVDYWMRANVRSLEVFAVLGEERTIELGGN